MIRRRAMARREDGAAAVEFALIGTVLLLLLFGIIEFGLWLSEYEAMASAAREGARVASVRGDPTQVQDAVTQAAAPYTVTNMPPTIVISGGAGATQCSDTTLGRQVTVSWTQNFTALNLLTILPILPDQRVMQGTFRCE